jgi:hypothetical protein
VTGLEDRLRRELHELRPSAESLRPLRVPSPRRFARAGRWPRLAAPLAAAVAVIVVAVLAVGVGGHPRTLVPRRTVPPSPISLGTPPPSSYGLPAYYIGMLDPQSGGPQQTFIGNLTTGTRYHIQRPSGEQFNAVAAAANDRAFVVVGEPDVSPTPSNPHPSGSSTLYLAHLDVADRSVTLTRLPIPIPALLNGLAVAPDGSAIAVSTTTGIFPKPTRLTSRLEIYSLTGRLIRQWTSPGAVDGGFGILTEGDLDWAWNGELAFRWSATTSLTERGAGIWVLNTNDRSGSLLGSSRLVVPYQLPHGYTADADFALSANGEYVAARIDSLVNPLVAQHHTVSWFGVFSTVTGRLVSELWPVKIPLSEGMYWSGYSGSQMIVQVPLAKDRWAYGVLTDGKFAALPRFPEAFWVGVSF